MHAPCISSHCTSFLVPACSEALSLVTPRSVALSPCLPSCRTPPDAHPESTTLSKIFRINLDSHRHPQIKFSHVIPSFQKWHRCPLSPRVMNGRHRTPSSALEPRLDLLSKSSVLTATISVRTLLTVDSHATLLTGVPVQPRHITACHLPWMW